MNYCINLKKRKNKPFCKMLNKEIMFSCCRECAYKEYKNDIMISNYNQIKNSTSSLQNTAEHYKKIKNKSNKLANLERNRKSVFTDDLEHCYLCGQAKQEIHEIFCGRNRLNSIKYNFILPLCHNCHSINQNNADFNDFWHRQAQLYFEENIGSREEFIKVFRRNYLD